MCFDVVFIGFVFGCLGLLYVVLFMIRVVGFKCLLRCFVVGLIELGCWYFCGFRVTY